MTQRRPNVLALDLEGTLISNAMSQIPRPRLFEFLEECRAMFPRIVMFTTVSEERFRAIASRLVSDGLALPWFAGIEYIAWKGDTKDLRFIPQTVPAQVLLVDDFEIYVHPGQEPQWVRIEYYGAPYPDTDENLLKVLGMLRARVHAEAVAADQNKPR